MDRFLFYRYREIISYTGLVTGASGAFFFFPAVVALSASEALSFLVPGTLLLLLALLSWQFLPRAAAGMTMRDASVVIFLTWALVSLVSSYPFISILNLTFTQAVFESVSGWTTTGLSVVNVEQAPQSILLWRSLMQGAGGAGFAILMLGFLASPLGTALSSAEGKSEQLVPHVKQSAKLVAIIYSCYIGVGFLAYVLTGLSPFDAINHSLCAVSTGGFSTKVASIGHWKSVGVEAVTIPLMILGNLSFLTAWLLIQKNFKMAGKNPEVQLMAVLIPVGSALVFLLASQELYPTLSESIRVAIFEVVSALTTTGFSTTIYSKWNHGAILILIILMVIGGGTYSTAGGLKQARVYLLFRSMFWEIRRAFLPRQAVIKNYIWSTRGKEFVTESMVAQVGAYAFLYMSILILGTVILVVHGISLQDALFEYASTLGTVGLSVGVTGPNLPPTVLWTQTVGMFLGRLEFLVVFRAVLQLGSDMGATWTRARTMTRKKNENVLP